MDLKSYLVILRGNIWVILLTAIVTMVVVIIITIMTTPTYTATTTLRVATAANGSVGYSDYMYADRLMNTYIKLSTSRPVLNELANKLNLQTIPQITVALIPNTELIRISVDSSDPLTAQNSANSLAEIIIVQGKELYSGGGKSTQEILSEQLKQAEDELKQARDELDSLLSQIPQDTERIAAINQTLEIKERTYSSLLDQYDQARLKETMRANLISVVEPAILPARPSKPNKAMNLGLGLMVGVVGGIGLAFLIDNLVGTRLYSSKQIEAATELNIIGKIPTLQRKKMFSWRKIDDANFHQPFREAFRRLHVQLLKQNQVNLDNKPFNTFLITSSEPGEGKSTITANLAIAIAQSGKRVIVVDCDLHIPRQHKIHGLANNIGLSTLLSQPINAEKTILKTRYPGMYVLTSGPIPLEPAKMLSSPQMTSLVQWLSKEYDIVLLDTPAFLAVADTAHLASIVDGVVLVVRRNFIREEVFGEACKQLSDLKAPMLGLVVNEAERNGTYYYYQER